MKKESMKKVIALALSAVMAWGFVACGTPGATSSQRNSSSSSEAFSSEEQSSSLSDSSSSFGSSSESSSSDLLSSSEDSSEASSSWVESSSDSSEDSSSGKDDEMPQGIVPYDGSEVTITFYHTMGAKLRSVLDKYIPKFNEKYPNIRVEHTTLGDYVSVRDQIRYELATGRSPNLAYCYPEHVALYKEANAVLTLDDYIASTDLIVGSDGSTETMGFSQAQLDDFIPAFYEEGKACGDGYMYTLPMLKSTEVSYYNKTFFEEHNLTVPTTWDEMEAVCAQIKSIDTTCIPLGYDNAANWFITMTQQLGTPYTSVTGDKRILFNTAENRAFVERFTGWYQKGYVTTEEILGSYTSDIFTQTGRYGTKSYMCIGSSAGASYQCPSLDYDGKYPFEVGVAMIPQANPETPKVVQQGASVCLFKKENPQEQAAAWLFAKYLATCVEFQAEFSISGGYTPAIKSATEHPVYQDFLSRTNGNDYLQAAVIKQSLVQVDAYYYTPAFAGSFEVRDEVGYLLEYCFTNAPKEGAAVFIEAEFKKRVDNLIYDYGY